MIAPDVLKEAVELAPGFNWSEMKTGAFVCCDWGDNGKIGQMWRIDKVPTRFLDALAAELERLAENQFGVSIATAADGRQIVRFGDNTATVVQGDNRTVNRINAIVQFNRETGVLSDLQ